MSKTLWNLVEGKLNEHTYMRGVERTVERVSATAEIFTPSALVLEIFRYLDLEILAPGNTVLDPACGDGQFLVAAKWVKIFHHGMSEEASLSELYGVDLMRDNVDLCKRRLGGGNVIMGDSLCPQKKLEAQTAQEHREMIELYSEHGVEYAKKSRVSKNSFADTLF